MPAKTIHYYYPQPEKDSLMTTAALQDVKPYTMAEINAMIGQAEADIAAGRVYSSDEVMKMMDDFVAQYE